jgi:DNA-binding MarR family transcriptional regulator
MSRTPVSTGGLEGPAAVSFAMYGLMARAVRFGSREISMTAASTLATLNRAGPMRLSDLGVLEGISQPAMTTLVSRLEAAGLVERSGDPRDGRVVLVAPTPAGAAAAQEVRRSAEDELTGLINQLPPKEIAALIAAVPALLHLQAIDEARRIDAGSE